MRSLTPSAFSHIDPHLMPIVVLSDNLSSWFSRRIKRHTKGDYNHAMIMHYPGRVATQEIVLRDSPIGGFLTGTHRLKLWRWPGTTQEQRAFMLARIEHDLAKPWYKRRYDPLGLVGQLFRVKPINNPWAYYCSEWVASVVREAGIDMGRYPSPADIDRHCIALGWECVGVFDPHEV